MNSGKSGIERETDQITFAVVGDGTFGNLFFRVGVLGGFPAMEEMKGIGENGSSRNGVDRGIVNVSKYFGGTLDESALIPDVTLNCECFRMTQQGCRDVSQKHTE